jgi:hypothetical protein
MRVADAIAAAQMLNIKFLLSSLICHLSNPFLFCIASFSAHIELVARLSNSLSFHVEVGVWVTMLVLKG